MTSTTTLELDEASSLSGDKEVATDARVSELSLEQPFVSRGELQYSPQLPPPTQRPCEAAGWLIKAVSGLVFLVALLAIAASIPLANVLVLGYLMEVQGRVARTGKFRSAFYLLPLARRLGIIVLAVSLWLLPIRFLAGLARDSWLLAPASMTAWLSIVMLFVTSVLIASHLVLAMGYGGRWWHFLRPLRNLRQLLAQWPRGTLLRDAHHRIAEVLAALQLTQLLLLGVLGYVAAYSWLVVPTLLFTHLDDITSRWQQLVFGVGCVTLTLTLMGLPLLMAHVAAEGRYRALLEVATVFKLASRTPLRWAIATSILLGCSILPMLYTALVKNQIPPHAMRWDLMVVFLVTVMPARVLVGWAYHRASQRPTVAARRWPGRIWQWTVAMVLCVGVGYYVYFLYLAETGGELGQQAVWQFHSVLQPLPF